MNSMARSPAMITLIGSVALLLVLTACVVAAPPGVANESVRPSGVEVRDSRAQVAPADSRSINSLSVSGEGRALVTPDLARVTLGVEVRNPSLEVAMREAATRLETVMALLKAGGVGEKDIRTIRFDVQPIQRMDETTRRPISDGFMVVNLLQVTFRDLKRLGPQLDQVVTAGATTIQGIAFDVTDPTAADKQARAAAVADATNRAEQLAKLSGMALGKPISITEAGGGARPIPVRDVAEALPAAGGAATPIEPGQSEVRVFVQIQYAIQ